jgi:hypothetical protein
MFDHTDGSSALMPVAISRVRGSKPLSERKTKIVFFMTHILQMLHLTADFMSNDAHRTRSAAAVPGDNLLTQVLSTPRVHIPISHLGITP